MPRRRHRRRRGAAPAGGIDVLDRLGERRRDCGLQAQPTDAGIKHIERDLPPVHIKPGTIAIEGLLRVPALASQRERSRAEPREASFMPSLRDDEQSRPARPTPPLFTRGTIPPTLASSLLRTSTRARCANASGD
jgi:hypothetical protein